MHITYSEVEPLGMTFRINVILQHQIILIVRYFVRKLQISWLESRLKN